MGSDHYNKYLLSRRTFLKGMQWTPLAFLPATFHGLQPSLSAPAISQNQNHLPLADLHISPHYPAKSPLEEIFRYQVPGSDEYITEKHAEEIARLLDEWSQGLKVVPPALSTLAKFVDVSITGPSLTGAHTVPVRAENGINVSLRQFASKITRGRELFLEEMKKYFFSISQVITAEFQIVSLEEIENTPLTVRVDIRYDLVGVHLDSTREQRVGHWLTVWSRDETNGWQATKWDATKETLSQTRSAVFVDITSRALGEIESYKAQMLRGVDHWRTVLDGACGIDVYGNNGVAVGDMDGDGFDAIYICQPSGLPNRLYRNRGDGEFEDVTKESGVDVLDATACALFADFENKGLQDLLVVGTSGPLLFLNQGNGRFELKRDAFKFARPPQGTFTHAAIADYDRDGRLDIYFCLYSYYQGLDQYRYPVPYFDARNGPPNFLLHNEGHATFIDRTEATGLNVDNDRYSFASAWGDANSDGWPDLYVANDFGRGNLYRNNGDGTFTAVSTKAGVEDPGAGMSACWFDFDNDGKQDIYVANMWSAAGTRVSQQRVFHERDPENIRGFYRQHARGNSLYQNQGNGQFKNISTSSGTEVGRWAWSSDSWDFDHDGYSDLYVANGYVSGPEQRDLGSFFWRQVVGKSPASATPSPAYEQGWGAINELIRSDTSWAGYERNVFYLNNRDGTFSDVSGMVGLDFPDDSRSFALADIDHDGRLEVILKNRNAPQLRVLRNAMAELGGSVSFRLRGTKSNRDAIGTAVTLEAGTLRQTKYLQAGSGFLSQHSKELFFGVGRFQGTLRALIQWPSGRTQTFESLPISHRIEIEEGSDNFQAKPFGSGSSHYASTDEKAKLDPPSSVETWLLEPLSAPEFSLPDIEGNMQHLQSFQGNFTALAFWTIGSPTSIHQLRSLKQQQSLLAASGLRIVGVNVDDSSNSVRPVAIEEKFPFPILLATQEVAGIYNILCRYLFDRRRDLSIPTSFLLDKSGMIIKVYQGFAKPEQFADDVKSAPRTSEERIRTALPFSGTLCQSEFRRNVFSYGVALFQRGYLEPAAASFKQVIAGKPDDPEAYYNLGTLELRRSAFQESGKYLEQAVKLRPNYPEAWNNLGMLAAQQGKSEDAVRNFQESLRLKPDYVTALLNLGNLYRRQRSFDEAEKLLTRAFELQPDDAETNYSVGMFYAQQQKPQAKDYLEKAISLRPGYADALNNLGVLLVREERYREAEEKFRSCIRTAPNFDQAYLNLARLYVLLNESDKAKTTLRELLRLQPQHKVAQQALEMLH
jgi:Flp pilus assembly protein TadD/peroxiredoxin